MSATEAAKTTGQTGTAGTGANPGATSRTGTEYVVLGKVENPAGAEVKPEPNVWVEVGRYSTRSPKAAVSAHLKAARIDTGTFVAVPVRNFEPMTPKTETQTRIVFS